MTIAIVVLSIICVIVFLIIKSEIDKLKRTVQLNKESSDKESSILNSEIETANTNIAQCNSRLDNAAIVTRNLTKRIEDNEKQLAVKYDELAELIEQNKKSFDEKISKLAESITEIKGINKELRNQLANFTEIDSDSMRLNADASFAENEDDFSTDIELDDEQAAVLDLINNSNTNLLITGKAGTGKSFLLRHFVKNTGKRVLVLAPTGVAALNANGITIHRAFGGKNLQLNIDEIEEKLKLKDEKRQVLKRVQTIIIDEISMVRADVFENMDRILKFVNNNDLPFGGKQMLLFGDLFQLPPFVTEEKVRIYLNETFHSIYFFASFAYKNGAFKFCELSVNHRQKDDAVFFNILNNVRDGKISDDNLKILNTCTEFEPEDLRRIVRLLPKKVDVEDINKHELDNIIAKEYVYESKVIYQKDESNNIDYDSDLPISETLKLKQGALVMMVTNDIDHRWVNGTLGIISFITEDCIKVTIDGREYEVLPATFTQQEADYKNGKITYKDIYEVEQYPLVLAYAITIHKSQGMTYKTIACDVRDCFAPGQTYVALSRCTNIEGLYLLRPIGDHILGAESEVIDFYKQSKSSSVL